MAATVATICVSLQPTTVPYVLPSHTVRYLRRAKPPLPEIVTCVNTAPVDGETDVIFGALGVVELCTVMEAFAETLPKVAVMVALPLVTPMAKPGSADGVVPIKPTELLDELHVT